MTKLIERTQQSQELSEKKLAKFIRNGLINFDYSDIIDGHRVFYWGKDSLKFCFNIAPSGICYFTDINKNYASDLMSIEEALEEAQYRLR